MVALGAGTFSIGLRQPSRSGPRPPTIAGTPWRSCRGPWRPAGRPPLALSKQEAPQVVWGDVFDQRHLASLQMGYKRDYLLGMVGRRSG